MFDLLIKESLKKAKEEEEAENRSEWKSLQNTHPHSITISTGKHSPSDGLILFFQNEKELNGFMGEVESMIKDGVVTIKNVKNRYDIDSGAPPQDYYINANQLTAITSNSMGAAW